MQPITLVTVNWFVLSLFLLLTISFCSKGQFVHTLVQSLNFKYHNDSINNDNNTDNNSNSNDNDSDNSSSISEETTQSDNISINTTSTTTEYSGTNSREKNYDAAIEAIMKSLSMSKATMNNANVLPNIDANNVDDDEDGDGIWLPMSNSSTQLLEFNSSYGRATKWDNAKCANTAKKSQWTCTGAGLQSVPTNLEPLPQHLILRNIGLEEISMASLRPYKNTLEDFYFFPLHLRIHYAHFYDTTGRVAKLKMPFY